MKMSDDACVAVARAVCNFSTRVETYVESMEGE